MNIHIEGNIGSGKSTLIKALKEQYPSWTYHVEPVNEWRNWNGVNLLENFYKDPFQYTFVFQTAVLQHYTPRGDTGNQVQIWERSALSGIEVFSRLSLASGYLSPAQFNELKETSQGNASKKCFYIYLRTDPVSCLNNVRARGREEEKEISLDYLVSIHSRYESVFSCRQQTVCLNYDNSKLHETISDIHAVIQYL